MRDRGVPAEPPLTGLRLGLLGASGQVGTELVKLARTDGLRLTAPTSSEVDITDALAIDDWIATQRPDVIVNCAAYTAVDAAEDDRERAFAVNAIAPGNLARAGRRADVPIVHLSTDYVFSGEKTGAYIEDDPAGPLNVYGASKLEGERAVLAHGGDVIVLRVSWVFSAHGRNFVKTILTLTRERAALSVVNDQLGGPCSARAIAAAIKCIAPRLYRSGGTLYHFSAQPFVSWFEFATAIVETGVRRGLISNAPRLKAIPSSDYPTKARRPMSSCLDGSRLRQDFGLEPSDWRNELDLVIDELAEPGT